MEETLYNGFLKHTKIPRNWYAWPSHDRSSS